MSENNKWTVEYTQTEFEDRVAKIAADAGLSFDDAKARTEYLMRTYNVTLIQVHVYKLCAMSDKEVEAFADRQENTYQGYVNRICHETGWSREEASAHMDHCFDKYHLFPARYMAMRCWQLDDAALDTYLTTADQYALVDKYNDPDYQKYFDSKPLFNETFKDFIGRDYWVSDGGRDTFAQFIQGKSQIFCKPFSAFGGHGARVIDLPQICTEADLNVLYNTLSAEPALYEECIQQHPHMASVHASSVNSTRVVTVLKDDVCHVLFAFTRFGNGSFVDNFSSGGICAAVDEQTGKIITRAVDLAGNVYDVHPASGVSFKGFQIPMWDEALKLVEAASHVVPQIGYVGWDVAFTPEKPILIEGNTNASMTSYQTCFGLEGIGKRYLIEPYL